MSLSVSQGEFRDWLVEHGWLRRTSVDGVIGRMRPFVQVERGLDALITRRGVDQDATVLRFPPVFPREAYLRTDYLASFPNLTGSVHSFDGDERGANAMLATQADGGDWAQALSATDLMMVSASCHPAYELFSGTLDTDEVRLDIEGWCFRREPSADPARAQSFRQREYVYIGNPDGAQAHRDRWVQRGLEVLETLQLPAVSEIANDPFFGRAGRMLAANQIEENLKIELVVPLYGEENPGTALVSSNCHRDHFGHNFAISTPDGEVAHTSCVGFGIERIVVGLARHHGPDLQAWPAPVREALSL
jgi:seryl-tRNA synthetase